MRIPLFRIGIFVMVAVAITYAAYLMRYPVARTGMALELSRIWSVDGRPSTLLVGDSRIAGWSPYCEGVDGKVWNLGISGTTTAFWQEYLFARQHKLPKNSNVILWVGVNDIMNKQRSAEATAQSVVMLARELSSHHMRVLVLGQIPIFSADGTPKADINARLQALDTLVARELSNTPRAQLISLYATFASRHETEGLYADGIHLTQAGNRTLCQLVHGEPE